MANTGFILPQSAETVSESPYSNDTWVSPENIYGAGEASITSNTFDGPDYSYVLKAYNYNLSSIPAGATIDGVVARINSRASNSMNIVLVQLLNASRAKVGTNLASTPVALSTSATDYDFGAADNKWGNALDETWVKDADFGVAYAVQSGSPNADLFCDYISIDVYYTEAGVSKEVLPGVGVATFTGFLPTILLPIAILAGLGEATLTGYEPTVAVTNNISVSPDVGVLTFNGYVPDVAVTVNKNVDVGLGELLLTGYEPTVFAQDLKEVSPDVGVLTFTGIEPTIDIPSGVNVSPDVGVVLFTGYESSVVVNTLVNPDVGVLTLIGFYPTVVATDLLVVSPDVGILTLTGYEPTVALTDNIIISPDIGIGLFTGIEPIVFASNLINVNSDVGELSFIGFAPTVGIPTGAEVSPALGELVFTGYAPDVIKPALMYYWNGASWIPINGFQIIS